MFSQLEQLRKIISNTFVLNMVKGHHLQLRCCLPLFLSCKWFNIEATAAHHHVIQKVVDELFAISVIEWCTGGTGFYSNAFVVPKYTGGLQPILNLKQFNHCMHIPTVKMPTIRQVWQPIEEDGYTFSIDLQDTCLHIPSVRRYCQFICLAK